MTCAIHDNSVACTTSFIRLNTLPDPSLGSRPTQPQTSFCGHHMLLRLRHLLQTCWRHHVPGKSIRTEIPFWPCCPVCAKRLLPLATLRLAPLVIAVADVAGFAFCFDRRASGPPLLFCHCECQHGIASQMHGRSQDVLTDLCCSARKASKDRASFGTVTAW